MVSQRLIASLLRLIVLQAGIITFSTSIIKGGVEKFALKQPIFLVNCSSILLLLLFADLSLQPSPIDPLYSQKVCQFRIAFFGTR